jgi:hypothetical protein
MMHCDSRRTAVARVLAGGLCVIILGGAVAGVGAVPSEDSPIVPPVGATGSLTLHVYDTRVDDPSQLARLTGINGAEFQVTQITGVDVATNEGWAQAGALVQLFDPANSNGNWGFPVDVLRGAPSAPRTTAGASGNPDGTPGRVIFDELPIGLYIVEQTTTPAGFTPVRPFAVTIPMVDAGGTGWNFAVQVVPKNVGHIETRAPPGSTRPDSGMLVSTGGTVRTEPTEPGPRWLMLALAAVAITIGIALMYRNNNRS